MKKNNNRSKRGIQKQIKGLKKSTLVSIGKANGIKTKNKTSEELIEIISSYVSVDKVNDELKIKTPNTFLRWALNKIWWFIGALAVIVGLIVDLPNLSENHDLKEGINHEVYYHDSSTVQVLILPFQSYTNEELDIGLALNNRFEYLNTKDSARIKTYYFENYELPKSNQREKARSLMDSLGFDIVLYGEYEPSNCASQEHSICLSYLASENYLISSSEILNTGITNDLVSFQIQDILKGNIQGNIEYAIFKIKLLIERYQGDLMRALTTSRYIVDSLMINSIFDLKELFVSYVQVDSSKAALRQLNRYVAEGKFNTDTEIILKFSIETMLLSRLDYVEQLDSVLTQLDNFLVKEVPPQSLEIAQLYQLIGEFTSHHFPHSAIFYLLAANMIISEKGDNEDLARSYQDLALGFFYLGEYTKSLDALENALKLYEEKVENKWLIIRSHQLAVQNNIYQGEISLALNGLNEIEEMIKSTGILREIIRVRNIIAETFISNGYQNEALNLLKENLEKNDNFLRERERVLFRFITNRDIALIYHESGNYQEADRYFELAFSSLKEYLETQELDDKSCEFFGHMLYIWNDVLIAKGKNEKARIIQKEGAIIIRKCKNYFQMIN